MHFVKKYENSIIWRFRDVFSITFIALIQSKINEFHFFLHLWSPNIIVQNSTKGFLCTSFIFFTNQGYLSKCQRFCQLMFFWVKLTQKFFNFHVKTVIRNDFFSSGKCSWQNFWQIHIRIIFYSSKFLRNDMRYTFWVKLTQSGSMKAN